MEEETKTSTSVLLASAVVSLVVLLTSPLGYKFNLVPLQPSIIGVTIAFVGGALVIFVGLCFLIVMIRANLVRNRNLLTLALLIGLIPVVIVLPYFLKGVKTPPVHDISTDTDNPPAFVAVVPLRTGALNPVEYGSGIWSAAKLGSVTRQAYPDIKTQHTDISLTDAVYRSQAVLKEMGLEIVETDVGAGRVEATATSFWFGFNDDVIVRVAEHRGQVSIDLRSKSRVGQSDIGANAERIREFIRRF